MTKLNRLSKCLFLVTIICFCSIISAESICLAEKGLAGYWKFDDKGEIAKDFSGNGNDGTIYGAVATAGKIGQALKFDGDDDYVDCGRGVNTKLDHDITFLFWFKTTDGSANTYISNPVLGVKGNAWLGAIGIDAGKFTVLHFNGSHVFEQSSQIYSDAIGILEQLYINPLLKNVMDM